LLLEGTILNRRGVCLDVILKMTYSMIAMRTTVVIDDKLWPQLKALVKTRQLSEFINRCVREYFAQNERVHRMAALEKAYQRAAKKKVSHDDFDAVDHEDWPAW